MKKLFALFGNPVSHSRSPLMHNAVFKHLHYDASYIRINLEDGTKLRDVFFSYKLSGANITVPHKEVAYKACDEVRGFAKVVGVVNTIINEDGRLIGYNTDADGFIQAIEEFGKIDKVLIIGAGGTAKALASRFIQDSIKVDVLNRSVNNLVYFQDKVDNCYTWDNFELKKYDLVVNTTSAGLKDENLPAPKELIEKILQSTSFVADAIYGKLTPFLQLAKDKNITYKDGADMLLGQGVLANQLFVDKKLKLKNIQEEMQKSFEL